MDQHGMEVEVGGAGGHVAGIAGEGEVMRPPEQRTQRRGLVAGKTTRRTQRRRRMRRSWTSILLCTEAQPGPGCQHQPFLQEPIPPPASRNAARTAKHCVRHHRHAGGGHPPGESTRRRVSCSQRPIVGIHAGALFQQVPCTREMYGGMGPSSGGTFKQSAVQRSVEGVRTRTAFAGPPFVCVA